MSDIENKLTMEVDLGRGVVIIRVGHPLELEPKEAVVSIVDFLERSAQITVAVMQQQRRMAQQLAALTNGGAPV